MNARETFEAAAAAARRLPSIDAELAALGEGWRRGDWMVAGTSAAGHSDPTGDAAAYHMRRTSTLEAERESLAAVVAEAQALARGVGELLGSGYRDALTLRYLENRQWREVAELLGVCVKTANNWTHTAIDAIDGLGRARVLEGRGVAAV